MNSPLIPLLKRVLLVALPGTAVVFSFLPLPKTVFTLLLVTLWLLWVISFWLEGAYPLADIPLLFLMLGTFTYGKAFSLTGFGNGDIPILVTELSIGFSFLLLLLKEKSIINLWNHWRSLLPKDLMIVIVSYLAMGTVYILLGYSANGAVALRDIVICHYIVLLFFSLSLLARSPKQETLTRMFLPGVIIIMIICLVDFFIRVPGGSAFRQLIRLIKMTNLSLSAGLIVIFGLSFLAYFQTRKKQKIILGVTVYAAFLLLILSEVRAGWMGLVAALILLVILLKKEMKSLLVILLLLGCSLWIIDYFQLTIRKNKLANLANEITSMTRRKYRTIPGGNIKWRLGIWKETLEEIKKKPLLGSGFGVQIDYMIWGKRLSWRVANQNADRIVPVHNHILAVAHKMGLVGLALFLFINGRIFFYGLGYLKKCRSEFNRRFLIACLAGLFYWHGMALFFDVLESPPTGIFLWILLGAVLAIVHTDKKISES
ncbi:MAG: hypothetical protein GY940_15105 [bacterium]|nr:hypothetical protein [bacterium]